MMNTHNLINWQKPEFGNPEHIKFVQTVEKIFTGQLNFHTIEWQSCFYWGTSTDTGKPKFRWANHKNANALVDYIPCPKCGRLHCLLFCYDPQGNWYDELIMVDEAAREFECWNCGLEFETDEDRNVFVKTIKPAPEGGL